MLDLLEETGFLGYKPAATLIDPNVKLALLEDVPVAKGRYKDLLEN